MLIGNVKIKWPAKFLDRSIKGPFHGLVRSRSDAKA